MPLPDVNVRIVDGDEGRNGGEVGEITALEYGRLLEAARRNAARDARGIG